MSKRTFEMGKSDPPTELGTKIKKEAASAKQKQKPG
jgi:hypothetical protein